MTKIQQGVNEFRTHFGKAFTSGAYFWRDNHTIYISAVIVKEEYRGHFVFSKALEYFMLYFREVIIPNALSWMVKGAAYRRGFVHKMMWDEHTESWIDCLVWRYR